MVLHADNKLSRGISQKMVKDDYHVAHCNGKGNVSPSLMKVTL